MYAGKQVDIKTGMYKGEWGVITLYDGEYFHVALWGDTNTCLVFTRNEITIRRNK